MDFARGFGVGAPEGTGTGIGSVQTGEGVIDEVIADAIEAGWLRMRVNLSTGEVRLGTACPRPAV